MKCASETHRGFLPDLLLLHAIVHAQTVIDDQSEDTQFWNETQIIFPMRDRVDSMLFGVLRMGRDLARPVDEPARNGRRVQGQQVLSLIIPTGSTSRSSRPRPSKNIEHRLVFNATFKFPLPVIPFAFTDRNLIERRL